MQLKKYILLNKNKVDRAMAGNPNSGGTATTKVVRKDDGSFDEAELLAYYDRLGGAILTKKEESRVKIGSFWDFKNNKPFEKPKPVLTFRINGKVVETEEEAELPNIVKAAQQLEKEEKKLSKDKKK